MTIPIPSNHASDSCVNTTEPKTKKGHNSERQTIYIWEAGRGDGVGLGRTKHKIKKIFRCSDFLFKF